MLLHVLVGAVAAGTFSVALGFPGPAAVARCAQGDIAIFRRHVGIANSVNRLMKIDMLL